MALRVTGGQLRGRSLDSSRGSRPTSGRAREALFSRLQRQVEGGSFLDLFCAGGTIGIEALSRGAATVAFADRSAAALRVLRSNLSNLELEPAPTEGEWRVLVRRLDLPRGLAKLPTGWPTRFDVIFADPPYAYDDYELLLENSAVLLASDGALIVEHDARVALRVVSGLSQLDSRRYGDSALTTLGRS